MIDYFLPQPQVDELPSTFENPFKNKPHKIALRAIELLKNKLSSEYVSLHPFFNDNEGKMFGVLVVQNKQGKVGYLSAFSGQLNNEWIVNNFVPPIFDVDKVTSLSCDTERDISTLTRSINKLINHPNRLQMIEKIDHFIVSSQKQLESLKQQNKDRKKQRKQCRDNNKENSNDLLHKLSLQSQDDKREYKALKKSHAIKLKTLQEDLDQQFEQKILQLKAERKQKSKNLHNKIFDEYQLLSVQGEELTINNLFPNMDLPPGGAGDCAAPKLIQYALKQHYKLLALSEFWWGASPKKEIRHHGQLYPPCRSKCHSILPFMLRGLYKATEASKQQLEPEVVYEDESIIILNKPSGLLSIPGKKESVSVLTWLKEYDKSMTGAILLHRLDQATSGVMIAAKNSDVYKEIQKQFINREIKKRYVALLSKPSKILANSVNLPLRVDLDDRPRQLVCFEHGKPAETQIEIVSVEQDHTRVNLYPKTGRTHQLRIHAAHKLGLDNPIIGDELYGVAAERLMLHAEQLAFFHPTKKCVMSFEVNAPF